MKDQIIEKAAEMFLTLGVKSVTMDEIAAEMGISKKTIYANFSTKSKLIEETAMYVFEQISKGIQNIRDDRKDPIEELFEIKDFACQNLKDKKSSPQHQLQKYYPKIYTTIREKQKHILEELTKENLQKGIREGVYRSNIPVAFTSRIYFMGIVGIKDQDFFDEGEFHINELTEMHLEYHLRAIVTDKGLKKLETYLTTNSTK
ncbi:TetR/AcrR family transcriptional regulator [Salinimicrobium sp. TH3]|uniref:TetR/AcrR family transcriptional regulator n=1 Tax=Salinimicrobium sp. TH3 TaxID=2997342 RepID=UPI002273226F|nr:TetR/AcrR family transcriptional regulator [Salinimicrobium sp. TH3]MCY2685683.1 TetR/AcrR family transcriptional regulator [Salinimicrobium sp. TH3]